MAYTQHQTGDRRYIETRDRGTLRRLDELDLGAEGAEIPGASSVYSVRGQQDSATSRQTRTPAPARQTSAIALGLSAAFLLAAMAIALLVLF